MKSGGELIFTIDPEGKVRIQIVNNDSPNHGDLLTPFEKKLSDGERGRVNSHRHDHSHGHTHTKDGGHH